MTHVYLLYAVDSYPTIGLLGIGEPPSVCSTSRFVLHSIKCESVEEALKVRGLIWEAFKIANIKVNEDGDVVIARDQDDNYNYAFVSAVFYTINRLKK